MCLEDVREGDRQTDKVRATERGVQATGLSRKPQRGGQCHPEFPAALPKTPDLVTQPVETSAHCVSLGWG